MTGLRLIPLFNKEQREAKKNFEATLATMYQQVNCFNCDYINELPTGNVICTKFNMTPPPRIIAFGCPEHDYIPF